MVGLNVGLNDVVMGVVAIEVGFMDVVVKVGLIEVVVKVGLIEVGMRLIMLEVDACVEVDVVDGDNEIVGDIKVVGFEIIFKQK